MTETPQWVSDLIELRRLLFEAYEHYYRLSDGYGKSSEGWVELSFGTYFESDPADEPVDVMVYSYVFGPSRQHHFKSVALALEEVKTWHTREMSTTYCPDCRDPMPCWTHHAEEAQALEDQ